MSSTAEEVRPSLVIVTVSGDSHAYVVALELEARGFGCAVVEVDCVSGSGGVIFRAHGQDHDIRIKEHFGRWAVLADAKVVWWRRTSRTQRLTEAFDDRSTALIHADSNAAATGAFLASPHLRFVSQPFATYRAENKLLQLSAAQSVGFRIPETLVSNDFANVVCFLESLGGEGIVKPVRGTSGDIIDTRRITPSDLDERDVRAVPLIYQRLVPGSCHLRVNVFGQDVIAARITTDRLDWRRELPSDIVEVKLEPSLERMCRHLCAALSLRMGIIDIKLDASGSPTFLEINPQGQFLFLEPLINIGMTSRFAQFLLDEMSAPAAH